MIEDDENPAFDPLVWLLVVCALLALVSCAGRMRCVTRPDDPSVAEHMEHNGWEPRGEQLCKRVG